MPKDLYGSARAKVARAKKLAGHLRAEVEAYDGARLCAIQADPNTIHWQLQVRENPHDSYATAFGDIVHNLRAALDHVAVAAVASAGGNTKGVYFPIADKADTLDDAIKDKKFSRATPEAQALLRSLRPYRGGDRALRALHDLDVVDKHKDLIRLSAAARQTVSMQVGGVFLAGNRFSLRDGAVFLAHPGTGAAALAPLPVTVEAVLGQEEALGGLAGQEMLPAVDSLVELVDGIVEAFAAL